jgi:uncharacterized protein (DUF4415 family)
MNNKANNELGKDFFDKAKPFKEVFPNVVAAQKASKLKPKVMGRPKLDNPKKLTSLRLDADVIEFFKKDGKGWQTRLNKVLKEFVLSH